MRALVFDAGLRFDADYPDPIRPAGEVLIRVRLAGICNTDLELVRGYMAFQGVLGHEFVGEVMEADNAAWVGRRVVGDINAACYRCEMCLAGRHTHCPNRTTLGIFNRDGALADYLLLPEANLYPVPDAVPDEAAVFNEPLAAACEILEQVKLRPTDRVVVLGDGKLGLLVAAVLRLAGAELTLVGRHADKLSIAEGWGIEVWNSNHSEAAEDPQHGGHRVADSGQGRVIPSAAKPLREASLWGRPPAGAPLPAASADVVVECTGSPAGFAEARRLLRPRGTLVLKSTYHGDLTLNMSTLVVDEITIVGSRCGPFAPALRLLEAGLVDPTPLITACYPLAEGEAAFAHAGQPGVLKVLVRP